MKRFDFPLDRVRRWRLEQAELEELKLQQLHAELATLGVAKRQIAAEMVQTERELLAQPSMDALELENLGSFRFYVRARIRDFENREQQCQARIDAQLRKVVEARRQSELLERLHQKARGVWRKACDKEQEDLATELFLARWNN